MIGLDLIILFAQSQNAGRGEEIGQKGYYLTPLWH